MSYMAFTLLPFMVCLFWTVIFILEWRSSHPAMRVLTLFMSVCTALYFSHSVFFNQEKSLMSIANCVYSFCNLAVFPIYYLYIRRLTNSKVFGCREFFVLIPSVLMLLWSVLEYVFDMSSYDTRMSVQKILFFIQLVPVCYYGFSNLRKFDEKINNYYTSTEKRNINQTRVMMAVFVICSLCSATLNQLGREYFSQNPTMLVIPSLSFGTLLFAVGYVGLKQEFCIDYMESEMPVSDVDGNDDDDIQIKDVTSLVEQIDALMSNESLYLQSDLRITDVADRLNVSRTIISKMINQNLGMSFSEYVNKFRVRHAQKILRESSNTLLSVTDICEQCGFASESSFYRVFHKETGMTPKMWKSKLSNNE